MVQISVMEFLLQNSLCDNKFDTDLFVYVAPMTYVEASVMVDVADDQRYTIAQAKKGSLWLRHILGDFFRKRLDVGMETGIKIIIMNEVLDHKLC